MSTSSSRLRAYRTLASPAAAHARVNRDPLETVLDLGANRHVRTMLFALLLALVAHGTAAARVAVIDVDLLRWTQSMRFHINERLASTYDIEVEKPKPPEPPPEPEKEAPKPVEKAPPPPKEVAPKDTPPPPPAAAQAGAVLTQKPDDTPVDFTNSIVTGNGESYAGGVTQATGTSTTAVYNRAAQTGGVPAGTGTAPAPAAPAGVDRSRALTSTKGDWNCTFPSEADTEQIDDMTVAIEATVGADGRVTSAHFVSDPGYGFGRAAVQCAIRQGADTFSVALDRSGNPVPATKKFNVHFTR